MQFVQNPKQLLNTDNAHNLVYVIIAEAYTIGLLILQLYWSPACRNCMPLPSWQWTPCKPKTAGQFHAEPCFLPDWHCIVMDYTGPPLSTFCGFSLFCVIHVWVLECSIRLFPTLTLYKPLCSFSWSMQNKWLTISAWVILAWPRSPRIINGWR